MHHPLRVPNPEFYFPVYSESRRIFVFGDLFSHRVSSCDFNLFVLGRRNKPHVFVPMTKGLVNRPSGNTVFSMGCWEDPSDHNTNHRYRLTAIPLTRYPLSPIMIRGGRLTPYHRISNKYRNFVDLKFGAIPIYRR